MNTTQHRLLAATIGLIAATPARAVTYTVDPVHSKIQFKVKHLGISMVTGGFDKFTGTFDFDPSKQQVLAAGASIDAASIDTGEPKRDADLRSANFFDVEKSPEIRFASKSVEPLAPSKFKITGDLTMHGVTRAVVFDAELGGTVKDPRGMERAALSATTTIDRRDFGLTWNKVLEGGGLLVGNNVQVVVDVEGVAKAAEGAARPASK